MGKCNIYYRRDGRWEGRILTGKTETGKRKYKYIFGRSREVVERSIQKFKAKSILSDTCACGKSFEDVYDEWLKNVKLRIKESTAANYTLKARKHILPEFGKMGLSNVNSSIINEFIEKKAKQGLSARYITDIIVLMKSVFKYAVRLYNIIDPMISVITPKKKKAEITLLDKEEQKVLENYVASNNTHTSLGVAVSMATGIRIGELCALQWKDIDMKKRILTVRKTMQRIQISDSINKTKIVITEPKSESSKRDIPIPECLYNKLKQFKGKEEEYVLSGTEKFVEPRTMQYRFSKILKNVKLPSIHYHALRHIFASNCVKWGFDVKTLSELLGHSFVKITLDRYVHTSLEEKKKYMDKVKLDF